MKCDAREEDEIQDQDKSTKYTLLAYRWKNLRITKKIILPFNFIAWFFRKFLSMMDVQLLSTLRISFTYCKKLLPSSKKYNDKRSAFILV